VMPYDFIGHGEDGEPATLNAPSPEGREMGLHLAQWTDVAEPAYRRAHPSARERCGECAFRRGSIPNRCLPTVANALKCAFEGEIFYCHRNIPNGTEPTVPCAGWLILTADDRGPRPVIQLPPMDKP